MPNDPNHSPPGFGPAGPPSPLIGPDGNPIQTQHPGGYGPPAGGPPPGFGGPPPGFPGGATPPQAAPPAQGAPPQQAAAAPQQPTVIRLHTVEIPLPTDDVNEIMHMCIRPMEVPVGMGPNGPIMEKRMVPAITPECLLTWIETYRALGERDKEIEALKQRVAALEAGKG